MDGLRAASVRTAETPRPARRPETIRFAIRHEYASARVRKYKHKHTHTHTRCGHVCEDRENDGGGGGGEGCVGAE